MCAAFLLITFNNLKRQNKCILTLCFSRHSFHKKNSSKVSSNTFWINHYQRLCFHLNATIRPDWPVAALCVQLVNSFVCYQTYEDDILKMTQLILMEIGTSGPRARTWNDQLWHSGGQKVKVTQYQNQLQKSLFDEISQELSDEL